MTVTILPPFVGGAEAGPYYMRFENRDTIVDMTGYTYRAEVIWDGCPQISLAEDAGITRLVDNPSSDEFHYFWGLTETQGKCVPIGVTPVKLYSISPSGVTTIDVVNLKRTL